MKEINKEKIDEAELTPIAEMKEVIDEAIEKGKMSPTDRQYHCLNDILIRDCKTMCREETSLIDELRSVNKDFDASNGDMDLIADIVETIIKNRIETSIIHDIMDKLLEVRDA